MVTREAFLRTKTHRICFYLTPKHASWLNQIEIWFSILARKLLRRGSFTSQQDLKERIERFIAYFDRLGKAIQVDQDRQAAGCLTAWGRNLRRAALGPRFRGNDNRDHCHLACGLF